jgi:hypothetical protein
MILVTWSLSPPLEVPISVSFHVKLIHLNFNVSMKPQQANLLISQTRPLTLTHRFLFLSFRPKRFYQSSKMATKQFTIFSSQKLQMNVTLLRNVILFFVDSPQRPLPRPPPPRRCLTLQLRSSQLKFNLIKRNYFFISSPPPPPPAPPRAPPPLTVVKKFLILLENYLKSLK